MARLLFANEKGRTRKGAFTQRCDRESRAIGEQALAMLRKRGKQTGSTAFLDEAAELLQLLLPADAETGT